MGLAIRPDDHDAVVVAARAGAPWAVERLWQHHNPALVGYLRGRVGQDAEDVASQVWLEVARALPSFRGDAAAFRRWLFTTAHRRAADEFRHRRRHPAATVTDGRDTLAATGPGPADVAVDGMRSEQAVTRISALLPADQAEIVLLRVVAGLSVDEVASVVGRKPGAVRVAQHRALRRLAERLTDGEL